ncbi:MAG: hypothetical protein A2351_07960 [Omnitrophica bacterium RIFOXYB12_FULL_50_7]|nr:MAG: hypothetical protein A2351_07960 [Omnitrophica bacterium RIFOXYB12_FULL_50_7]
MNKLLTSFVVMTIFLTLPLGSASLLLAAQNGQAVKQGAASKGPQEEIKSLERRITAGNEFLSKQDVLCGTLDGMISEIRQIQLHIPASITWKEMDETFSKRTDSREAAKYFSLLSQALSSLSAGIMSDAVTADAGNVTKEAGKAGASLTKLEEALRMTPEQIAGKMKADGSRPNLSRIAFPEKPPQGIVETKPEVIEKMLASGEAVKAADLTDATKPDEQTILSGRSGDLIQACESSLTDLQQLRLSLTVLSRSVGVSLALLNDEVRALRFRLLGKPEEGGKK